MRYAPVGIFCGNRSMLTLGYKLRPEDAGSNDLVRNTSAPSRRIPFRGHVGSFLGWIDEQGHSPLAWSVLGAIAQTTERMG